MNFGSLTAEIGSGVWGTPANFNRFRVLASLLQRRHSLEAKQTLHDVIGRLMGRYTIYTFSELLPPDGILPGAKFSLRPKSCVLLSQRAPPIFGWAAITLGIGPHSRLFYVIVFLFLTHDYVCSVSLGLLYIFVVIMVALCNRADHCDFYLCSSSFFFFFFSSPNLSGRRLDVYHTSTHGVALERI